MKQKLIKLEPELLKLIEDAMAKSRIFSFSEFCRQALKAFAKDMLAPDLRAFLSGPTLFSEDSQEKASTVHAEALATLGHRVRAIDVRPGDVSAGLVDTADVKDTRELAD